MDNEKKHWFVHQWVLDLETVAVEASGLEEAIEKATDEAEAELQERGKVVDVCPTVLDTPEEEDVVLVPDIDPDLLGEHLRRTIRNVSNVQRSQILQHPCPVTLMGFTLEVKARDEDMWMDRLYSGTRCARALLKESVFSGHAVLAMVGGDLDADVIRVPHFGCSCRCTGECTEQEAGPIFRSFPHARLVIEGGYDMCRLPSTYQLTPNIQVDLGGYPVLERGTEQRTPVEDEDDG